MQENIETTNKLLRAIVALLVRENAEESKTLRQQIEILDDIGFRPIEIAETLGRPGKYVNKELSRIRKGKK